jgi:hypothetical protein
MIDYIKRVSSATSSRFRPVLPNAIPFVYDEATKQILFKEHVASVVRSMVSSISTYIGGLTDSGGQERFIPNPTAKTIVDGSATALFEVAIAAAAYAAGVVHFAVFASDGTDHQVISGILTYSGVNKAGTITKTATYVAANEAKAVSSGTLTLSFTTTDDTNKMTVKLTPTGSLTETVYTVLYSVFPLKGAVTIL